jgi:hypothetical protein
MEKAIKAAFGLCVAIAVGVVLILGFGFSGGVVQFVIGGVFQTAMVFLGIGTIILLARILRSRH